MLLSKKADQYTSLRICEYNVTLKKFNEGIRSGTVEVDIAEQADQWGDTIPYTTPIKLGSKLKKELWKVLDKGYLIRRIFGEKVITWQR